MASCLIASMLMLHAAWICRPGQASEPRLWPVIVIGAGLAGLSAGEALKSAGIDTLILEARDRIGGRVTSVSLGQGLNVDLGASWIHGVQGNPIMALTRRWQIETLPSDYDNAVTYGPDGKPLDEKRYADWCRGMETRFYELARKKALRDAPVSQLSQAFAAENDLDADARLYLDYLVRISFESDYGADAGKLSARAFEIENLPGKDRLIPKGYGQIVNRLAQGQTIALNQAVKRIDYRQPGEVRISTANGQQYRARRVIVTVPLGVLKSGKIGFDPPLPAAKKQALARLGMGLLDKLWLRFDRVFWDKQRELILTVTNKGPKGHTEPWGEAYNLFPALKQPVLVFLNAGSSASEIESLSDKQTVESAMASLRRLYGKQIPEPVAYRITRWQQDPWSLGAYSYLAVGARREDYRRLAEPVANRLFFAGEATHSKYPATTHGAYESGQRAAAEVLASGTN